MTKGKQKPLEECLSCSTSINRCCVQHAIHTARIVWRYQTNCIILPDINVGGGTLRFVLTASTVAFAHSWLQQKGLLDTVRFMLEEKGCLWECEGQASPSRLLNNGILRIIVIVAKLKGKACRDSQQLMESMAPLREGSFRDIYLGERNMHTTTSINLPLDLPSVSFLCY